MLACSQPRRTIRQARYRLVHFAPSVKIASDAERLVERRVLGEVLRIGIGYCPFLPRLGRPAFSSPRCARGSITLLARCARGSSTTPATMRQRQRHPRRSPSFLRLGAGRSAAAGLSAATSSPRRRQRPPHTRCCRFLLEILPETKIKRYAHHPAPRPRSRCAPDA